MNPLQVAIGAGVGIAGGVFIDKELIGYQHRTLAKSKADYAAHAKDRQPTIDRQNTYVDSVAAHFGAGASVHTVNGLRSVAIFDPNGEVEKYIGNKHYSDVFVSRAGNTVEVSAVGGPAREPADQGYALDWLTAMGAGGVAFGAGLLASRGGALGAIAGVTAGIGAGVAATVFFGQFALGDDVPNL